MTRYVTIQGEIFAATHDNRDGMPWEKARRQALKELRAEKRDVLRRINALREAEEPR